MPLSRDLARAAGAALFAATLAAAAPAFADAIPISTTFTIDLPNYAVTDLVIMDLGSPFTALKQGRAGSPLGAGIGVSSIVDEYLTADQIGQPGFVYEPDTVFLMGVTSNLPGDAPGQQHLVLFTNDDFAQSAQSIAFGTLFPGDISEEQLIARLEDPAQPVDAVFNFASDFANGGGPNGAFAFRPGDSFTAIAFSDGQIIGTGTSVENFSAAPEPATWTLMLLGFGGLGASLRARRGRLQPAA